MKAKTRRRSGCLTTWACLHNTRCRLRRSRCRRRRRRYCRHVDYIRVKSSLAAAAPGAPSLAAATPLAFPGGALLVKIVRNAFCLHVQNSDSPEKVLRLNQRLSGTWTMLWRNLEKIHAAGFRHDTQVWIVWNRTRATHLQVVLTGAELRNKISTK